MYRPDFIVRIAAEKGPVNLVVEIKGERDERDKQKRLTMIHKWLPGVNALGDWGRSWGDYGKWDFIELKSLGEMDTGFAKAVENLRQGREAGAGWPGGLLDDQEG